MAGLVCTGTASLVGVPVPEFVIGVGGSLVAVIVGTAVTASSPAEVRAHAVMSSPGDGS